MKKSIIFIFIFYFFYHCSFDTKTGIWDNSKNLPKKADNEILNDPEWKEVFTENKQFTEEKNSSRGFKVATSKVFTNKNWVTEFYNLENNPPNLFYLNNKNIIFKSSKISKKDSILKDGKFLFYNDNIISSDKKGNIFSYSLKLKKRNWKFNFYKKKYKKFNKALDFIVDKNIVFVSDNLGYMYALNIFSGELIWAKNFGIPFRSNMKIIDGQIFLANQDNLVYSINIKDGNIKWKYSTTSSILKSSFKNNFAADISTNSLFFLSTSGELYSFDYTLPKVNWVINLKQQLTEQNLNLFHAQPIVTHGNDLLLSTKNNLLLLNKITGSKKWEIPITSNIKSIMFQNYAFIVSKDLLLTCIDTIDGNVIWSKKILESVRDIKIKLDKVLVSYIVNNNLYIFFNNGSILAFDLNSGNLVEAFSILKNKILVEPLIINGHFYILNDKNKIIKVD